MPVLPLLGIAIAVSLLTSKLVGADVVTVPPVADTSLFEFHPDDNFGRQRDLPAGALGIMGDTSRARVLYRYDLAAALPAGATIEAARMTLTVGTQIPESGRRISDFALSRVLVPWGEGDGFGERPGGRPAEPGEATWNHRFLPGEGVPGEAWAIPGGEFGVDYAPDQSALAVNVDGSEFNPTSYFFNFNSTGLGDIQATVDGTAPNHGWVLYSLSESSRKTARRWTSRETINEGPAPKLEITFSPPIPVVPPKLTSLEIDEVTQELLVRVEGARGFRYELQCGIDLTAWTVEAAQVPADNGALVFRLPLVGGARFVRIVKNVFPEGEDP